MKLGSHEISGKQVAGAALAFMVVASVGKTLWDGAELLNCPSGMNTAFGQVETAINQIAAGRGQDVHDSGCYTVLENGKDRFAEVTEKAKLLNSNGVDVAQSDAVKNPSFLIGDRSSFGPAYAKNKLNEFMEANGGLNKEHPNGAQSDCGITKVENEDAVVCNIRSKENALTASEFNKEAAANKTVQVAIVHDLTTPAAAASPAP